MLPDGSLSELSVSATLRNRSGQPDRRDLVRPIQRTIAELQADGELPQVTKPGAALTRRADLLPPDGSIRKHHGETPGPGAEPDGGTA
jgi:NADH-quinone oxidoreductase subunit J